MSRLDFTPYRRSTVGFDYDYGYGVIDPAAVLAALKKRSERAA